MSRIKYPLGVVVHRDFSVTYYRPKVGRTPYHDYGLIGYARRNDIYGWSGITPKGVVVQDSDGESFFASQREAVRALMQAQQLWPEELLRS